MKALLAALLVTLAFPAVARPVPRPLEEVPFVVSPDNVTMAMLKLANVGPEDYLIDLGSGDGRIVVVAAKRFGARGLGVEIVPGLVEKSRAAARAAGVESRAFFREQDLFKTDLSPASVVTMYLLPDVNLALRPKLLQLRPGTRVVSHDWDMGEWQPDKTVKVDVPDKPVGVDKASRIHLWVVPARIQGTWCGTGKAKGATIAIGQEFSASAASFPVATSASLSTDASTGSRRARRSASTFSWKATGCGSRPSTASWANISAPSSAAPAATTAADGHASAQRRPLRLTHDR